MPIKLEQSLSDLTHLGGVLHQAALDAQSKIDAIPDNVTDQEVEDAIIEAIDLPWRIAGHMIELTPRDGKDADAKARAQAYMDGEHFAKHGRYVTNGRLD